MRALVISGGGSKGAYAGGVAQYLIEVEKREYDIYVGTSTGSLLMPHLVLGKVDKIKSIFTNVRQGDIFNINPFIIRRKGNREFVSIRHWNVLWQFLRGRRTFGESKNLRRLISKGFTEEEFLQLKRSGKEVEVTVANLTRNILEYKSIKDFDYNDFCDWMWLSSNYVPFMSMVEKNGCEYADGGFGATVPILRAIRKGAKIIDVIVLETENMERVKRLGNNPFSLMISLSGFAIDQIKFHNIEKGKLAAKAEGVVLNMYYTPSRLTENSLIFDKKLMRSWWQQGFESARNRIVYSKIDERGEEG